MVALLVVLEPLWPEHETTAVSAAVWYESYLSGASDQGKDHQHDHRADGGVDDIGNGAAAKIDAQLRQQPACHQRTDDADHDVADQPETGAANDQAGEPAGDRADHECRDDTHAISPA